MLFLRHLATGGSFAAPRPCWDRWPCLLAAAPAAGAATRLVAPGAANAGNCSASPCGSLGYAYQQSAAGDVIRVAGGVYPAQVVPGGSKAVTFSGSPGAKLRQLENNAANVTFDGIEVDAAFAQTAGFQNHDAANVTFRDGRIGNVTDEKGALVSGARLHVRQRRLPRRSRDRTRRSTTSASTRSACRA